MTDSPNLMLTKGFPLYGSYSTGPGIYDSKQTESKGRARGQGLFYYHHKCIATGGYILWLHMSALYPRQASN